MVPATFHFLLVKRIMTLIEVRCAKCGCRRVLPRDTTLEQVRCRRCDHVIHLRPQRVT